MRYFENVKPGGNGGGWVDPFSRVTLDRYSEQIELTMLAKARRSRCSVSRTCCLPSGSPTARSWPRAAWRPWPATRWRAPTRCSRGSARPSASRHTSRTTRRRGLPALLHGHDRHPHGADAGVPRGRRDRVPERVGGARRHDRRPHAETARERQVGGRHVRTGEGAGRQGHRNPPRPRGHGSPGAGAPVLQPAGRRRLGGRPRHRAAAAPLSHERLVGGDHRARRAERLSAVPPRGLRAGAALRPHRARQPGRPLRAARVGAGSPAPRHHRAPAAGAGAGTEPRFALRLRQQHVRRALVPRPQHDRRGRRGRERRRDRGSADRPGRAQRPGARGRDGLHRHAAAAHQLGLRAPPRRRHRSVRPRPRAQPAARARREHHRLRRHLEGPRAGPLQGRPLREDPRGRVHVGPDQPAPVQAHGRGQRLRAAAFVARDARLGGEGCPRGGPRRRARHARVRRDGRRPGRPEGRVARVLAAGGAALGTRRTTSRWSC